MMLFQMPQPGFDHVGEAAVNVDLQIVDERVIFTVSLAFNFSPYFFRTASSSLTIAIVRLISAMRSCTVLSSSSIARPRPVLASRCRCGI
jgi:hypothetical protein